MKFQDMKNDLEKLLIAQFWTSTITLEEKERVISWADDRYQEAMNFYTGKIEQRSSLGWINAIEDVCLPEVANTPEKARTALMDSMTVYLFYDAKSRLVGIKKEMDDKGWKSQAGLIQSMVNAVDNPNETQFEIFWDRGGYGFRPSCRESSIQSDQGEIRERLLQEIKLDRGRNPIIDKNDIRRLAMEKQRWDNSFNPYMEKGIYICLGRGYDAAIRNTDMGDDVVRNMISKTTKKTMGMMGWEVPLDESSKIGPRYFRVAITGDLERDVISFRDMDIVAGPFRSQNEAGLAAPFVFEERYFKKDK